MRSTPVTLVLGLAACGTPAARPADQQGPRPNVVIIMTDDQGYGDFTHAGNPVLETPRLDALAAASPRVERFYVHPVCAPTRACLLTGRYNYRTRVVDTWRGRALMDPAEVTLAEILHGAGYRTGIFGKWHLGDNYPLRPIDQGFDEALIHRGGGLAQASDPIENGRRYTDAILFRDGRREDTEGYCTDVYFDAALDFVDRSREEGRPFFAYVAPNAPHDPFHDVPAERYAKYRARDLSSVATRADADLDRIARTFAMIENIDRNVGRLLDHLDATGLAENTLVVFLCDNGPLGGRFTGGLRGTKTGVYEGGIRSRLFVRLGAQLSAETVVEPLGAHIDLLPTVLDATGVEPSTPLWLDGRSLWPLLRGREVDWPERKLVIQSHRGDVPVPEHHFTVVGQRWKLLRASGFGREELPEGSAFELYDLLEDPGERNDLAGDRPELVRELRDVYGAWFEDVSRTRIDNYAPPRIVVDAAHEDVTVLTRNDWRRLPGSKSDSIGAWHLSFPRVTTLELHLLFRGRKQVSEVDLVLRPERAFETRFEVVRSNEMLTELKLAPLTLPPGEVELRLACRAPDGEEFDPYQVELHPR